jgi:hypothetical protein
VLAELHRIQSADVVLPTLDGRELRLRCVVLRVPPHRDHADQSIVVSKIMIVVTRIAHRGHGVRYPSDRGMAAGS